MTWNGKLIRHRCESWVCTVCGPCKQTRFRAVGKAQVAKGGPWWELGLTLPAWAARWRLGRQLFEIHRAFTKLIGRLRRRVDRRVAYLAVPELTVRGVVHLHALVDVPVSRDSLATMWKACGGGQQVEAFQPANPGFRVVYFSKHLLLWAPLVVPRGFRRYRNGGGFDMRGVRPRRRTKAQSTSDRPATMGVTFTEAQEVPSRLVSAII